MKKLKIITVFGTRPEAIKMAPVIKKLREKEFIETLVLVSAQHREMLDQVLNLFSIKTDYDLNIMKGGQSLSDITVRVLKGLENVYRQEKPDLVLVHGDTSTTFSAALAAYYQQIEVGHVEAGLRTYNKFSPFPEEMNRHLTGVLADLHFAPTTNSRDNLLEENIPSSNIFVTGNTVIDALMNVVKENYSFENKKLNSLDFDNKRLVLLTSHRRENLGQPMENIFSAVRQLTKRYQDIEVVFPVHLNPQVQKIASRVLGDVERIHLIEPLDYEPFANLVAKSYLVLTDSGGIQEEAPGLAKPVLVLRNTTERPEAVKAGTVKLVGTDRDKIFNTADELLKDKKSYQKMANAANPYGDGLAGQRIVNRILYEYEFVDTPGEEYSFLI